MRITYLTSAHPTHDSLVPDPLKPLKPPFGIFSTVPAIFAKFEAEDKTTHMTPPHTQPAQSPPTQHVPPTHNQHNHHPLSTLPHTQPAQSPPTQHAPPPHNQHNHHPLSTLPPHTTSTITTHSARSPHTSHTHYHPTKTTTPPCQHQYERKRNTTEVLSLLVGTWSPAVG